MPKQSKPKKRRVTHTFDEWVEAMRRELEEKAKKELAKADSKNPTF